MHTDEEGLGRERAQSAQKETQKESSLSPNSEVARRAAGGSAGLQPAVSRVFNPQTSRTFLNAADCRMTCRLQVGATPLGSPNSEFGLRTLRLFSAA
jgi:hypothetical protein